MGDSYALWGMPLEDTFFFSSLWIQTWASDSAVKLCCGVCSLQMSKAMDWLISVNTELSQHPAYNVSYLGWFPGMVLGMPLEDTSMLHLQEETQRILSASRYLLSCGFQTTSCAGDQVWEPGYSLREMSLPKATAELKLWLSK